MHLGLRFLALCAASATVVACSEKSDPPPRPISYTGSTAAVVISDANVASLASTADELASGSVSAASGGTTVVGAASVDARTVREMALAAIRAARRQQPADAGVSLAGVTQGCPGGGKIAASGYAANQYQTTTGDWVEVTFIDCRDETGTKLAGTLRLEITGSDGIDPSMGPGYMTSGYPYGMKVVARDFSIEDANGWAGIAGDVELTTTWNASTFQLSSSIHGSSLVSAAGVGSAVSAASLIAALPSEAEYRIEAVEAYTNSSGAVLSYEDAALNAKVCSIEMNGCAWIEMTAPFRKYVADTYPDSGSLRISDALGRYIEVQPTDGTTGAVTVSWDVVLDATTPDGTCNTFWSTMGNDQCLP